MAFDLVIRNGTLVSGGGRVRADLGIANGAIAAVGENVGPGTATIDATDRFVLPGVIDGHVHFREPGLEHEETWLTGSLSAAMGGVTTVLELPNTIPPTDTVERVRDKLALAARSSYVDFGVFGLLGESADSVEQIARSGLLVGLKVFMGPTTGDLRAPDDEGMRRGLKVAREVGLRVAFHAEDRAAIGRSEEQVHVTGRTDALAHLNARPASAEVVAIDRCGRLLYDTGARGHILHLSSAVGLAAVERWRAEGVDLTCEVTPHHLFLGRDIYGAAGGTASVNPPIRGGADAAALRDALADGRIDIVASDHAPHLVEHKRRPSIWDVPPGFAGVETLLPLLLTRGVHEGWLALERLVDATSAAPARAWGLWPRKASLEVGSDADVTIIDFDRAGVIAEAALHGMNNLSPFEGWATLGAAVATIVRGQIVIRDGELLAPPGAGRMVGGDPQHTHSDPW